MRKKILIATDASLYSRKAMEYATSLAASIGKVDFVLLHVQPMVSQYLAEDAMRLPKVKQELTRVNKKNETISRQLLEECKSFLVSRGVDAGCIAIETQARKGGIAEHILQIAEDRSFDAVVVGRRGLSGLQELFVGSVTTSLLNHSRVIPVWVAGGPFVPDKVLVAVDGSSQSLRTVDHLAYIFSGNGTVRFEFLNIEPLLSRICEIDTTVSETTELEAAILTSNQKCISDFSAQALTIFANAGIEKDRIRFHTLKKQLLTGKAIVDYAQKEKFRTVVIGKSGAGGSSDIGKVAKYAVQKLSDDTVWVVP